MFLALPDNFAKRASVPLAPNIGLPSKSKWWEIELVGRKWQKSPSAKDDRACCDRSPQGLKPPMQWNCLARLKPCPDEPAHRRSCALTKLWADENISETAGSIPLGLVDVVAGLGEDYVVVALFAEGRGEANVEFVGLTGGGGGVGVITEGVTSFDALD
jgi:hypothetical protein